MLSEKYRHKITIQKKSVVRGTYGEETITWTDLATNIWAKVEPLNGREYFQAQQMQAIVDYRITTRYRADIENRPDYRAVYKKTRIFDILSVINVQEANKELVLMCKEFVT